MYKHLYTIPPTLGFYGIILKLSRNSNQMQFKIYSMSQKSCFGQWPQTYTSLIASLPKHYSSMSVALQSYNNSILSQL